MKFFKNLFKNKDKIKSNNQNLIILQEVSSLKEIIEYNKDGSVAAIECIDSNGEKISRECYRLNSSNLHYMFE